MNTLKTISGREASIFAALCEVFVDPAAPLPDVRDTDAAFALDANLAVAPPLNRIGLRVVIHMLELTPLALGYGARMRRLDRATRTAAIERLAANAVLRPLIEGVRTVSHLCYYGDVGVMRALGYDPQVVVDRAAKLRVREARW